MSAVEQAGGGEGEIVQGVLDELRDLPGALLPVLHGVQDALGYIPPDCVPRIAAGLNLSRAEVHGVISFYHYFRSTPPGRHVLQICRAESCQAMGSRELERHARDTLKIDYHQTSADGEVTLVPVYCLGNCACSPAVRVGDRVYGHVDSARLDGILDELATRPLEVK